MRRVLATLSAALLLSAAPSVAFAEPGKIFLVIGGEAYDGPPRFEVSFAGEKLGEASVDAAIDTANAGRFADAKDKAAFVQTFEFDVPEASFSPDGEVRIRLVNEAYGGEGSDRDRNLFLAAVAVNGRAVTVSGLTTENKGEPADNQLVGEFLLLADGNVEAISAAPAGGWPALAAPAAPAPAVAATVPQARTVEVAATEDIESAPKAEPAAPGAIRPPVPPRIVEADIAEAELPEGVADAVEVAAVEAEPAPAENPACGLDQLYNVVGFNENSNELTPRLMERLDQIIGDIGEHRCTVQITGYSSTQGAYATNALFAVERAQNVLRYLREQGLSFDRVSATGAGETDQFGPGFSTNRRVVITVRP